MISALLFACAIAANPESAPSTALPDVAAYKEAKANVGRDADAHVRLALWCEARGMNAERTKHLTLATLIDPANVTARGLLGMVQYKGKWLSPDAVGEQIQADPDQQARIREYLRRRVEAADNKPDDQMKLALWCDQNDLKDQATAHFHRAAQLDPTRELAWKHLGYKKEKGRWIKPEQAAAYKEMLELQVKANKYWKPILEKLRHGLTSHSAAERVKAEAPLAEIKDPAAVPAIWTTFAQGDARRQKVAVNLYSQIDAPGASKGLAMLSIAGRSADVRRHAVEILKGRDPRDFVELLIGIIRKPIEYEIRKPAGVNTPGELFVKGTEKNLRRLYTPISTPSFTPQPWDNYGYDSNGLPVVSRFLNGYPALVAMNFPVSSSDGPLSREDAARVRAVAQSSVLADAMGFPGQSMTSVQAAPELSPENLTSTLAQAGVPAHLAESLIKNAAGAGSVPTFTAEKVPFGRIYASTEERMNIPVGQMALDGRISAQEAGQRLQNDVQEIENYNAPIRDLNRKSRQVLADTVGTDLGDDPEAWDRWTTDLFGRLIPVTGVQGTTEVPTVTEDVPLDYQPQAIPTVVKEVTSVFFVRRMSCFAGGTPVRTIDGLKPIETLKAGDLVLTQDTTTGRVAFNPVVNIFHNPPKETLKISLEGSDDTIVPTAIHRFWKAGQGWIMARDLKPGDVLRTVGGSVTVRSVESDQTQPVYNLRVANAADYFVGEHGVLSHDNSLPNPVDKPFDRAVVQAKAADRN